MHYGRELVHSNFARAKGILMSTTFSGLGTAEVAAAMLAQEYHAGLDSSFFHVFSSCDCNAHCRQVLHAAPYQLEADHIFVDVADILCLADQERVQAIVDRYRAKYSKLSEQAASAAARKVAMEECEEQCLEAIMRSFDDVVLQGAARCSKCSGGACQRFPTEDERANAVWVECAGSPCIPFLRGAYGTGLGWLHPVTCAFFSWAAGLRKHRPDIVLHECVQAFPASVLRRFLNRHEDLYHVQSVVFSPEDPWQLRGRFYV